jgi:hypothetical protein
MQAWQQRPALLETVPRGGIAQNQHRMALQQYTMNSLGRRPQISRSPQAIQRGIRIA